jgi:hypothetical protein
VEAPIHQKPNNYLLIERASYPRTLAFSSPNLIGCVTMREECRLRVFENRAWRIFGPKSDEVTGEWRKLHNG